MFRRLDVSIIMVDDRVDTDPDDGNRASSYHETFVFNSTLMRLIAPENFIAFTRESFKFYPRI